MMIRWGSYPRWVYTGSKRFIIWIQRVHCNACGHTPSLIPDFLHPYRRYELSLLQKFISPYLFSGLGIRRLVNRLSCPNPPLSTAREWIEAFAHGAGKLLFDLLRRSLTKLNPLADLPEKPPPQHLNRVSGATKRHLLAKAHRFWHMAEHLYASVKNRLPHLHFEAGHLLPFLLHWLQEQGITPRIFWSPRLSTTPTEPF